MNWPPSFDRANVPTQIITPLSYYVPSAVFLILGLIALLDSLEFMRMKPRAWATALLVQGISLFISLIYYFNGKPGYIYGLMAFCIFMVLYLHHYDIQVHFQMRPPDEAGTP